MPKDETKTVIVYTAACDGGSMRGCTNLASMYEHATSVSKDETKALSYLKRACGKRVQPGCKNARKLRAQ